LIGVVGGTDSAGPVDATGWSWDGSDPEEPVLSRNKIRVAAKPAPKTTSTKIIIVFVG
jgi:hypothetical protein